MILTDSVTSPPSELSLLLLFYVSTFVFDVILIVDSSFKLIMNVASNYLYVTDSFTD